MNLFSLTDLVYSEFQSKNDAVRIKQQEKLFYYYSGRHDKIISYLENALGLTFNSYDIAEFQKNYINITKKVVDQLAVVYRRPAVRYFIDEQDDFRKRGKTPKTDYYNSILPMKINSKDRKAHRFAKLFNTSITEVYFHEGKINYMTHPSFYYDIEFDPIDIYKPTMVAYSKMMIIGGKEEIVKVVWTKDDHYALTQNGNDIAVGSNKKMVNPYGVLPFAINMEEEGEDFWGEGMHDLINANEQVNFLLTDLINGGVIMQAWGTPVAVNLQLQRKNTDGTTYEKRVQMGPKHPLTVENVRNDEVQPTLTYANANPMIKEVMDTVDWMINKIAITKGLNPASVIAEMKGRDTSGYSKIIDSLDQMEIRQDSIEACREFEENRFRITKAINNYHYETEKGKYELQKIDSELVVDFADIELPLDPQNQLEKDQFELKRNIISIIDIARRQNPDLTDEEIKTVLRGNKQINEEFEIDKVANDNPLMQDGSKDKKLGGVNENI